MVKKKLKKVYFGGLTATELCMAVAIIAALSFMIQNSIGVNMLFMSGNDIERTKTEKMIEEAMHKHIVESWLGAKREFLPNSAPGKPVCAEGIEDDFTCINLDALVPTYLPELPTDEEEENPNHTGYTVYLSEESKLVIFSLYLEEEF